MYLLFLLSINLHKNEIEFWLKVKKVGHHIFFQKFKLNMWSKIKFWFRIINQI